MCGIAGIVAFESRYAPSEELLRRMSVRIAHRGPDGEGVEIVRGPGETVAGLVHRRLAILDPDERSNQPFVAEHGGRRIWVTYNGEIYNYRELRPELEQLLPGFAWRTSGDTEVLAAAYLAWGEKCVERLLGMFAFAVFDVGEGTVFLARDRMGEKPLYYGFVAATGIGAGIAAVAFASELRALVSVPWIDQVVDESAVTVYLARGYLSAGRTIYRGARKLNPGSTRTYGAHRPMHALRYFDPVADYSRKEPQMDAPGQTRLLLEEAVQSQMVSDVPIGCLLSGGIDSSVIALCMRRALGAGQEVHTFTASFDDPRYDESGFAEEVARHLGTVQHTFEVTPDAAADLPALAASYGEPFADSSCLPTYYLARETRKHVKVALAGDGGDELFGGYDRYRAMILAERLGKASRLARRLFDFGSMAAGHPKRLSTRMGRFLQTANLPPDQRYDAFTRLFPPGILGAPEYGEHSAGCAYTWKPWLDVAEVAMICDRRDYLQGDLLAKVDRASMLVNLEVRAPFLDRRLVEFASKLPSSEIFKGGKKGVLRRAFASDLPKSVFKRAKMGFAVPIGEWFRGELRGMLNDLVLSPSAFCSRFERRELEMLISQHQSGEVDHSQRLFALVMLELWHRGR